MITTTPPLPGNRTAKEQFGPTFPRPKPRNAQPNRIREGDSDRNDLRRVSQLRAQRERERERERERQRQRQTDRQTDRQTEKNSYFHLHFDRRPDHLGVSNLER